MQSKKIFLIITILCSLKLFSCYCSSVTDLAYVYEYEVKEDKFSSQIIFQINVKSHSLKQAFQQLDLIQGRIRQKGLDMGNKAKSKQNACKFTVQTTDETIQPLYELIQQQMNFRVFDVTNILRMTINNCQKVAYFVDDIVGSIKQLKIVSVQHKTQDQKQINNNAIKKGIQEGHRLCNQMKSKLHKINKVQQADQFQTIQLVQQDYDEDIVQQQSQEQSKIAEKEIRKFSFQVQCILN